MELETNKEDPPHFTENLEFWMTNLPIKLKSIPIIYLAIPGSHDSTTFAITRKSKVAPDAEPIIQHLKFMGPALTLLMSRWSKTQNFNIIQQLNFGVRYFDLRISTGPIKDAFYFVHGLYSEQVENALWEFQMFLDTHPKEVVILDCQHFYAFTQANHEEFMDLLSSTFGHKLLPYTPYMDHLSLEYMTTQFHYQVILIYRSDVARFGQPLLWPSASFPTPWPNTLSVPKLISYLDAGVKKRNYKLGYVSQCVLTPTTWFVFRNFLGSLKSKCVLPLEKQKYLWLARQKPGPLGGINIIISDFVEYQDYKFCKQVVALNLKLLNDHLESKALLPPVDST